MKKIKLEQLKYSGWLLIPENKCEANIAHSAMDWALTVYDIDQSIRNKLKYGNNFKRIDEALQAVRDELREIMENRNISLEMIE